MVTASYQVVTACYLVVTACYLVVTARYLVVTGGYWWLLLVPTFSMNAQVRHSSLID